MVPCLTAQEEEKERHMMDAGSGVCGCLAVLCSTTTGIKMLQKKEKKTHADSTRARDFLSFLSFSFLSSCAWMRHAEKWPWGARTGRASPGAL